MTVPLIEEGTSITALSVSSSITGWSSMSVSPTATSMLTTSPFSIFSPKSGKANSIGPAEVGAGCGAGTVASACVSGAGDGAAGGAAAADVSTLIMACPTATVSPCCTRISVTVPLIEEGTSITALSVSSSMTGWSSTSVSPTATSTLTTSPFSIFSPKSGSANSIGIA